MGMPELRIIATEARSVAGEILKIWTGRTPEGRAYKVLKGVKTGELSLPAGNKEIEKLEHQNGLVPGSLRKPHQAALDAWAAANKPRTPRQDSFIY